VGTGDGNSSQTQFAWKDPHPFKNVQSIGLSTWDHHVCYRNIEMMPPVEVPSFMLSGPASPSASVVSSSVSTTFTAAGLRVGAAAAGGASSPRHGGGGGGVPYGDGTDDKDNGDASSPIRGRSDSCAASWLDDFDDIADVAVVYTAAAQDAGRGHQTHKQRSWTRQPRIVEVTIRPLEEVIALASSSSPTFLTSAPADAASSDCSIAAPSATLPVVRASLSHATLLAAALPHLRERLAAAAAAHLRCAVSATPQCASRSAAVAPTTSSRESTRDIAAALGGCEYATGERPEEEAGVEDSQAAVPVPCPVESEQVVEDLDHDASAHRLGPGFGYVVVVESHEEDDEDDVTDETADEDEDDRSVHDTATVVTRALPESHEAVADQAAAATTTTTPVDANQLAAALAPLTSLVDFVIAVPATEEEAQDVRAAVIEIPTPPNGRMSVANDTVIPGVHFSPLGTNAGTPANCLPFGGAASATPSVLIEFHVHRLVLATHSPFLHHMLTSGMRESTTGRLELPAGIGGGCSPLAVAAMLHFFYAGHFPEGAPVTELLVLCERYQATAALRVIAHTALDECATADNVLCLLELAPLLGVSLTALRENESRRGGKRAGGDEGDEPLRRLFSGCLDLAAKNITAAAVVDPAAFARLPSAAVRALLAHDALAAPDEDAVLMLTLRWAGYGAQAVHTPHEHSVKALTDIEEVLPYVRFPQLTSGALAALEEEEGAGGLFAASPVLRALIAEARLVQARVRMVAATSVKGNSIDISGNDSSADVVDLTALPGAMSLASDGSSVLLALADRRAAARREPRPCFGANLAYLRDGDANGVCRFIGSKEGTSQWTNPVRGGDVAVTASSPASRFTDPEVLVSDEFTHTSFAGPVFVPRGGAAGSRESGGGGEGVEGGWWQLDLGNARRLRCNYYSMRQDGSCHFPRHWELQGSEDGDGTSEEGWTTLRKHEDDATLCAPGQWGSWAVLAPASHVPVRFLRLKLTGPTTAGGEEADAEGAGGEAWRLCLCSFEFYGLLLTHRAAEGGAEEGGTEGGGVREGVAQ
jgi:hypothetical protein